MTTTTTTTITLSDRAPAEIVSDDWPVIAEASWHDGEVRSQANRIRVIRVRAHTDGRYIVYGWYETRFAGERDVSAGYVLGAGDDVVHAIRRVAGAIGDHVLAGEAIADLPSQPI